MAWIYLAEAAGLQRPWRIGSGQLPTVKTTPSLSACCYQEYLETKFPRPQFGTTLELFAEECSLHKSKSSTEDFHVRGTHLQDLENAWRISGRSFSGKLYVWSKKQKPRSFFSKMSGRGLEGLYQRSELHLKALATNAETGISPHPMLAYRTDAKDGFYLPTPCVKEGGYNQGGGSKRAGRKRYTLSSMWRKGLIPIPQPASLAQSGLVSELNRNSPHLPALWKETTGTQLPPSFVEWIMGSRIGASALESWAIPCRGFSTVKHSKSSRGSHEEK